MRDIYVLEIFTLDNFLRLIEKREVAMSLYILPYAMWVSVVMNAGMSCQMRREFLSFVVNIFAEMIVLIESVDTKYVTINKYERDKVQFAFSKNHMRRALNTLIIQLHEIGCNPNDLAMDRIGTHVLGCTFGMIRLLCQYKHSWKMILKSFSRSVLLDDLALILGHGIQIKERVNIGGIKITGESETIYIQMPEFSPRQLWESNFMFMLQNAASQSERESRESRFERESRESQFERESPESQFERESRESQFEREFPESQFERESTESHFERESTESQFETERVCDEIPLPSDVLDFAGFIQQFLEACANQEVSLLPKMWHGGPVSNSTILSRLISFCHAPFVEEDSSAASVCISDDINTEAVVARFNDLETPDGTGD